MRYRATRIKLVPGERCPARRNNSSFDKKVDVLEVQRHHSTGTRTCGLCGREGVLVTRSGGWDARGPISAWYYAEHTVPERKSST